MSAGTSPGGFRSPPFFADMVSAVRLLAGLPRVLRNPVTLQEARSILTHRLAHREDRILGLARHAIYGYSQSPYLPLLRMAGCEYGDLERLVRREGVEGALQILYRQGVYLTVDEARGWSRIVRGSTTFTIDLSRLQKPLRGRSVMAWRAGSHSQGRMTPLDPAYFRERAVNYRLWLHARGWSHWSTAIWGVPGGWSLDRLFEDAAAGAPAIRWFASVDPGTAGLHLRYRWSGRLLRWGSLAAGVPLPALEHVPIADLTRIARWMEDVRRSGGTPHMETFVSLAVRLCEAAAQAGIDLTGAQLTVGGEPATPDRMAAIRASGALAVPRYASTESGPIGAGCLAPEASDDLHVYDDWHALIQPGDGGGAEGLPPHALLVSSLHSRARFILLNVSLGDSALVSRRPCGCPMERLGWTTHIHTIRSFEKLTAGGVTFLDTEVARVLEEILPARFGGGPTDYQLVEETGERGEARVRLLVHPRLGPLEPPEVAAAFLEAIGQGSGAERMMELMWRQAGVLTVEREPPRASATGKILHVHSERFTTVDGSVGSR